MKILTAVFATNKKNQMKFSLIGIVDKRCYIISIVLLAFRNYMKTTSFNAWLKTVISILIRRL